MKRLVRYQSVPSELLPYLSTWDSSFKNWGRDATALVRPWPTAPPVEYFGLAGENTEDDARVVLHPVTPHFAGKVFVIVDASNSSATFQFAQVIQQNHLGLLVGQPTGGNRRGINGGAFFFLRLPHSHIELDLPLIGTFPRLAEPDAGLFPDVMVPKTAADVTSGSDREMVVLRRLLGPAPLRKSSN